MLNMSHSMESEKKYIRTCRNSGIKYAKGNTCDSV